MMHQISGILHEDDYAHARTKIPEGWSIIYKGLIKKHDMLWSILNQDFVKVLRRAPARAEHIVQKYAMVIRKDRKVNNNPLARVIKASKI